MKWLVGIVAVLALMVTVQRQASPSETEAANTAAETGVQHVDSVLQQGLSDDTYGRFTDKGKESADWFAGVGGDLVAE